MSVDNSAAGRQAVCPLCNGLSIVPQKAAEPPENKVLVLAPVGDQPGEPDELILTPEEETDSADVPLLDDDTCARKWPTAWRDRPSDSLPAGRSARC